MKKSYILSSVLLSSIPVASFADSALNSDRAAIDESNTIPTHYLKFESQSHTFNNKQGLFALNLFEEKITDPSNNLMPFELSGEFLFKTTDGSRVLYYLGGDAGNIAFNKIHDDDELSKYRGVSCSSTMTDCIEDFFIELRYMKSEKTWEITFEMVNFSYERDVILNFPMQIVPLTKTYDGKWPNESF